AHNRIAPTADRRGASTPKSSDHLRPSISEGRGVLNKIEAYLQNVASALPPVRTGDDLHHYIARILKSGRPTASVIRRAFGLARHNPQARELARPPCRATREVRTRAQPQDRQSPRPDHPVICSPIR